MTQLFDLPSDIINFALSLSNLDKEILRNTCKSLYKIIPKCNMVYDDPINCPFSAEQSRWLLSPKILNRDNMLLLLTTNTIKRSRLDLLELFRNYIIMSQPISLRLTAVSVGNLQVYEYLFDILSETRLSNDVILSLTNGHLHIFNFLENKGLTGKNERSQMNAASRGAIESGSLEIVIEIYNRGYIFNQNCSMHANNLNILKWLHHKGFIIGRFVIDKMVHRHDLEAIVWFAKMKFIPIDDLLGYCSKVGFVNGMNYLLDCKNIIK